MSNNLSPSKVERLPITSPQEGIWLFVLIVCVWMAYKSIMFHFGVIYDLDKNHVFGIIGETATQASVAILLSGGLIAILIRRLHSTSSNIPTTKFLAFLSIGSIFLAGFPIFAMLTLSLVFSAVNVTPELGAWLLTLTVVIAYLLWLVIGLRFASLE